MTGKDKFDELSLDDLSLEPMPDPNVLQYQPPKTKAEQPIVKMSGRNKKVTDRRTNADRRKVLRFEPDRRSGKDRRPRKSWDPGKNI